MPPALQPQSEIITLEQYHALPENRRVEVFEGVVYDTVSPSQEHQTILTELLVSLRNYIREDRAMTQQKAADLLNIEPRTRNEDFICFGFGVLFFVFRIHRYKSGDCRRK